MDATGPLRSPDGFWWWDGTAWQPIATLAVPPTPVQPPAAAEPVKAEEPAGGAWQPPAAPAAPTDGWRPPPTVGQPPAAESAPAAVSPPQPSPPLATEEVPSFGAWQPPPGVTGQPESPPVAAVVAPTIVPPAVAPTLVPQPPVAPPAPAAASPPPSPPGPGQPETEAPWPGWLPHSERSEAIVDDVASRARGGAAPPHPPASAPPQGPVPVAGAPPSGWVEQLYPARTALNANRQLITYAGLGVLGLIALFVLFQVLSQANLFGSRGGVAPDVGPTGTQFQQADGFLSGSLNPALDSVTSAASRIPTDCGGAHSVSCQSTLEYADTTLLKAIGIIDKGTFPSCLAASVVQTRHDLVNLDQAMKGALIGFKDNSDGLVTKGLADFATLAPTLKANGVALRAAEQSACPKTP